MAADKQLIQELERAQPDLGVGFGQLDEEEVVDEGEGVRIGSENRGLKRPGFNNNVFMLLILDVQCVSVDSASFVIYPEHRDKGFTIVTTN